MPGSDRPRRRETRRDPVENPPELHGWRIKCVQTSPAAGACLQKLGTGYDGAFQSTFPKIESAFTAKVLKACDVADLNYADLLIADGLGLGVLASECADAFQEDICKTQSPAALIPCLVKLHVRASERLLETEQPRAAELLTALQLTQSFADLPSYTGCGSCAVTASGATGKSLTACGQGIAKAGNAFAAKMLSTLQKCVIAVLSCEQTKDVPSCYAKAEAGCTKGARSLGPLRAKLASAVQKKCAGASGAPTFDLLRDSTGLNLAALAPSCAGLGVGALDGIDDYLECLQRHHECEVVTLIRDVLPKGDAFAAKKLLGAGAAALADACPAPAIKNASLHLAVAAPRFPAFTISKFLKLVKTLAGQPGIRKTSAVPISSGGLPKRVDVTGSRRIRPGFGNLVKVRYQGGTSGLGKGARAASVSPSLVVAVRRSDLVSTDYFALPLPPVEAGATNEVDLDVQYADAPESCVFDLIFATVEGDEVSDYAALEQIVDPEAATPTPVAAATPTATVGAPTPTGTPAPGATATPTPSHTATPTIILTPTATSETPSPTPTRTATATKTRCGAFQTITCGETQTGTLPASDSTSCHTFVAAGQDTIAVNVIVEPGPGQVAPGCWEILAPNGTLIPGTCGRGAATLLTAVSGNYTLRINAAGSGAGDYHVTLEAVSATFNGASNGPPQPTCQQAPDGAQPIVCGSLVAGTIDVPGDTDTYTFFAKGGESVSARVAPLSLGCVDIYAPDGSLVPSFFGTCTADAVTLPLLDGVYTVRLSAPSNLTGDYNLSLEAISGIFNGVSNGPPTPTCQGSDEGTTLIACGETVTANFDGPGDTDTFTFVASGEEGVSISAGGSVASIKPCFDLFSPDGVRLLRDACLNGEKVLPRQAGVYTILVTNQGATLTGAYNLTLQGVSDTFNGNPNGPPSPTCNRGTEGTQAIGCGDLKNAIIDVPGDTDTYTFVGKANDGVFVTMVTTLGALFPCARIFDPDGILLATGCSTLPATLSQRRLYDRGVRRESSERHWQLLDRSRRGLSLVQRRQQRASEPGVSAIDRGDADARLRRDPDPHDLPARRHRYVHLRRQER